LGVLSRCKGDEVDWHGMFFTSPGLILFILVIKQFSNNFESLNLLVKPNQFNFKDVIKMRG
jgi:hypothetical protein